MKESLSFGEEASDGTARGFDVGSSLEVLGLLDAVAAETAEAKSEYMSVDELATAETLAEGMLKRESRFAEYVAAALP